MFKHMQKKSKPDFGRNSGGGGKHFRGGATGLARDPHGKLGLRTGQSEVTYACLYNLFNFALHYNYYKVQSFKNLALKAA